MDEKFDDIDGLLTSEEAEAIVAQSRRDMASLSPERRARMLAIANRNLEDLTEAEDRAITENARADPDSPPLDDAFFANRDLSQADKSEGGALIRLDPDLAARLRATGKGWQMRANQILRTAMGLE